MAVGMTEIGVRLKLDGAQAVQASATQTATALQQLGASTKSFGAGAQLTGYQTGQLTAQLQDFFVQVQAGQSPMTAAIQQGSQLSAVFGGIGNAVRAVATLITPVTATIGAVVGAVGVIGYAFVKGSQEAEAYRKALVTTGNAAGVTASQLAALQAEIAGRGFSRSTAGDALAQLVASGQVAGSVLGMAADAAVRLDREGVSSIKDTAKAFADLGKDPVDAIKKLNEGQNFLTASAYKQIAALKDQGKEAQAAALAQETYATQSTARMKELEAKLGTVETAWRAVQKAAGSAWGAILNIGAAKTPGDAFKSTQDEIDRILAASKGKEPAKDTYSAGRIQSLRQLLEMQRYMVLQEIEVAQATSDLNQKEKKAIETIDKTREARQKAAEEMAHMAQAGKELAASLAAEQGGLSGGFVKQWAELNAARTTGVLTVEQVIKAQGELLKQQPFVKAAIEADVKASKAWNDAMDERERVLKELADAQAQRTKELDSEVKSTADRLASLQAENAAAILAANSNIALAVAVERVTLARMQAKRADVANDPEAAAALERQIALQKQILSATNDKTVREANTKAAEAAAKEWEKVSDQIGQSLADALMQGGKSAAEYLKGLFRTLVLRPIIQGVISPITGALGTLATGSDGSAAANNNATYLQAASAASSLYGYGKTAYTWAAGKLGIGTAGGTAAAAGAADGGAVGMADWYAGSSAASSGGSAAGASFGAYAGYAALIYAGIKAAESAYSKGFTGADQMKNDYIYQGTPEAATTKLFHAIGMSDKWANILGGSVALNHMFGYSAPQITSTGVQGTLGSGNFSGQAYADITSKAGWVRSLFGSSDKSWTETKALPEELGRFMQDAAASVMDQAKKFGDALGLPAEQLAGVTTSIKVALTDDIEANKTELAKAFAKYGDDLVSAWADAVKPLANYGETTAQTIQRVGGAISDVNDVLAALGHSALMASVDGAKAALALESAFGDLSTLQQAASGYLQNFYNDAERQGLTRTAIGKTLSSVGLDVPATRDEFRSLVDAQDLMTESGRQAFAALMAVQEAFAAVTEAARSAADIEAERNQLEQQYLELIGDTAALRARERAQIDASNVDLYDRINALKDEQDAAKAAAEASKAAEEAAKAAADAALASANAIAAFGNYLARPKGANEAVAGIAASKDYAEMRDAATSEWVNSLVQQAKDAQDAYFVGLNKQFVAQGLPTGVDPLAYAPPPFVGEGSLRSYLAAQQVAQQRDIEAQSQSLIEQWTQRGAQGLEMLAAREKEVRDSIDRLTGSISTFRDDLLSGSLSALSPEQRYQAAAGEFASVSRQAMAGDQAAAEQLQTVSRAYLEASRSYQGSAPGYALDFALVVDAINKSIQLLQSINGAAEAGNANNARGLAAIADRQVETTSAVRSREAAALLLAQRGVE